MSRYTDWTSGEPIEKEWAMTEPTTEAGRRLFTDNEPMDMLESDGVTWDDILAIEAQARADALREAAERVRALPLQDAPAWYSHEYAVREADVLAILEPKP
jgi:hypothetical protein